MSMYNRFILYWYIRMITCVLFEANASAFKKKYLTIRDWVAVRDDWCGKLICKLEVMNTTIYNAFYHVDNLIHYYIIDILRIYIFTIIMCSYRSSVKNTLSHTQCIFDSGPKLINISEKFTRIWESITETLYYYIIYYSGFVKKWQRSI